MIELYIFDIIIAVFLIYLLIITMPLRAMFFEFIDKRDKADRRFADERDAALLALKMDMRNMFEDSLKTVIMNANYIYSTVCSISDNLNMAKQQIIDSGNSIHAHIDWGYGRTYEQFDHCRKKLDRIETKLERGKRRRGKRTGGYSGRCFRRLAI